jgi:hypothetical protein
LKTKTCAICQEEFEVLYRIQIKKGKLWIFSCKSCLEEQKATNLNYRYGGTWKGKRH